MHTYYTAAFPLLYLKSRAINNSWPSAIFRAKNSLDRPSSNLSGHSGLASLFCWVLHSQAKHWNAKVKMLRMRDTDYLKCWAGCWIVSIYCAINLEIFYSYPANFCSSPGLMNTVAYVLGYFWASERVWLKTPATCTALFRRMDKCSSWKTEHHNERQPDNRRKLSIGMYRSSGCNLISLQY